MQQKANANANAKAKGRKMNCEYSDILASAEVLLKNNPSITADEMKYHLSEIFIKRKGDASLGANGCCSNPINDYKSILSLVVNLIRKITLTDKRKLKRIQDKIDQALLQLSIIN